MVSTGWGEPNSFKGGMYFIVFNIYLLYKIITLSLSLSLSLSLVLNF